MRLRRRDQPAAPISVVPMIDVLMIMLIFFMLTSSFLDLDMLPLSDDPAAMPAAAPGGDSHPLLIRLGADGAPRLQGRILTAAALTTELRTRHEARPDLAVTILPAGQAPTQALVTVMSAVTAAGITRLHILRPGPAP